MDKYEFFWKSPSVFSQWTTSYFVIDDIKYNCAEQYMMAEKARLFNDNQTLQQILNETNPSRQKNLGRKVKNFDPKIWNQNSMDIVIKGNLNKFKQNPEMLKKLLETDDKILAEASPYDNIWGIGMLKTHKDILDKSKWGKNQLGKALMIVREKK
jgi:ribA/ribD-fused uncharacterized protein